MKPEKVTRVEVQVVVNVDKLVLYVLTFVFALLHLL
jgi:hypothetical protein